MQSRGRGYAVALCVGVGLVMSGCASIVEGTTQTVTVSTTPAGALCELKRNGQTIGLVNPTPGSVVLDKSKDNVGVLCRKDGHDEVAGTLASEVQGMTFGNLILGGIVGVAIDAGSGAMRISIPLPSASC